mgnify:FL=1
MYLIEMLDLKMQEDIQYNQETLILGNKDTIFNLIESLKAFQVKQSEIMDRPEVSK